MHDSTRPLAAWLRAAGLSLALALAACAPGDAPSSRPPKVTQSEDPLGPAPGSRPVYKVGDPYEIAGVWYYPREDASYDETGVASWYGDEFAGRPTANGEIFDPERLTAAHTTLPMPSLVQVTNLENGRQVIVRMNDRGPFKRGRVIDLSRAAADRLGFLAAGTAKVRVRYLDEASLDGEPIRIAAVDTPEELRGAVAAAPVPEVSSQPLEGGEAPFEPIVAVDPPVAQAGGQAADLWVQAGAFLDPSNASRLRAELARSLPSRVIRATIDGRLYYRVRVGPWSTVPEADRALDQVIGLGHPGARIVVD